MLYFLSIIFKASRKQSKYCNYYLYQFMYGHYFRILCSCDSAVHDQKLWADTETFDWIKASFTLSDRTFSVKPLHFINYALKSMRMLKQKINSIKSLIFLYNEVFIILRDVTGHSTFYWSQQIFLIIKNRFFPLHHSLTSSEEQLNCGNLNRDPCCPGCVIAHDRHLSDRGVFSWKGISRATESFPVVLCSPSPD